MYNIKLILMDCEMPIMDGYHASEIIRLTNKKVPIIAMSGHSGDLHSRMCKQSGMDKVI